MGAFTAKGAKSVRDSMSLIIFYTIHFEIYKKFHPTFGNVIYLYTLMNFKYKKKNVDKMIIL
jgi:hypothetical protein